MKQIRRKKAQHTTYTIEPIDEGTKLGLEMLAFLKKVLEKTKRNMDEKTKRNKVTTTET